MTELLPALILPNRRNELDSRVLGSDGRELTATDFLTKLGRAAELRLMVSATDPGSADDPRVTWQTSRHGLVLAVAFEHGSDTANRTTSAAVVLDSDSALQPLPQLFADELGLETIERLELFLARYGQMLVERAAALRDEGLHGGQLRPEKKKPGDRRGFFSR